MARANFTGSEKHTQTVEPPGCSANLAGSSLTYFLAFNIVLSITAFAGNTLILVALQKDSPLHLPSKLLLRCEGCPILRQIYAEHCIVLYPHNNRLTIQYN